MSLADKRLRLAAALSNAGGIKGYARRPTVISVGDAWPLWRGMEPDGDQQIAFRHTWAIAVVCGNDEDSATAFIDNGRAEEVADVLHAELYVTSIRASTLPAEVGEMYALTITGESE